jgi:hypothetical protein
MMHQRQFIQLNGRGSPAARSRAFSGGGEGLRWALRDSKLSTLRKC